MSKPQAQWHTVKRTLREHDPNKYRANIKTIGSELEGATLLLVRDHGSPVEEYLHGDTEALSNAGQLAGFTVTPIDTEPQLPDDITACAHPVVGYQSRLRKVGDVEKMWTDYAGARKALETKMPQTGYVSITFRRQGALFEDRRIRRWISDELNQPEDSSDLTQALCARASIGAPSARAATDTARKIGEILCPEINNIHAHRSLPRFGMLALTATLAVLCLTASIIHPLLTLRTAAIGTIALALALIVTLVATTRIAAISVPHEQTMAVALAALAFWWTAYLVAMPLWGCLVPAVLAVAAGVYWFNWSAQDDIRRKPRRYGWPSRKRMASSNDNATESGITTHKTQVNAYGAHRSTLLITPLMLASALTPSGEGEADQQDLHPAPRALTGPDVIALGVDQNGRTAGILPENLFGGIAIFGSAGSGKSVLSHGIMQWADLHRAGSDPAYWGQDSRIIDFEMKDDNGVRVMQRFRRKAFDGDARYKGRVSYLADPSSRCIDLLGMGEGRDAASTASDIGDALQYIYDEGDIRGQSLDIIKQAFTIAVAVQRYCEQCERNTASMVERMRAMEAKYRGAAHAKAQATPMGWALTALAGADGRTGSARALGAMVRALHLEQPDSKDMEQAALSAEQLYGQADAAITQASEKRLLEYTDAPRNKIRPFTQVEHVFSPSRARLTWRQVLERSGDYHFVFTDRKLRDGTIYALPDKMRSLLGKWMMLTLWKEVTATCQDWQARGKHTMFVCDELSMLSGTTDSEILRQMKDQGRSFGWINLFSTQYPQQLPPVLLTSVCGYKTFVTFELQDAAMADKVATQLGGEDDGWKAGTVRKIPQYHVAVATHADGTLQPTFLVKVTDFDRNYR